MKRFLATTAIALVMANGAFAESHVTTDGTATEGMTIEAPATDGTTAAPDATTESTETMAPTDEAAEPADGAMTTDTDAAADDATMDSTATGSTTIDTTATDTAATDMGASDMGAAPAMMIDGYETLTNTEVTAEELTGVNIYGPDEGDVGSIGDLVIGEDGTISQVIVDVGGFLGLGQKPVAIDYEAVQIMKQTDGDDMRAYISMTEEQLEELPRYESPIEAEAAADVNAADPAMTDAPATDAPATDPAMTDAPAADAPMTDAEEPAAEEPAVEEAPAN
ncbi:PRC-barrel domain-containing protein [Loktanella sp. DJP18]|uniref:PRC-barrel domain-containing protein n=1 Tax=Loktanella sp. DJP18 TaxID=3409788 RepID=UPI003BB4FE73